MGIIIICETKSSIYAANKGFIKMEDSISSFKDVFDTWGYIALFLYCMGSGYVGILAAGVLAAFGHMNIAISILVAAMGNFAGSSLIVFLLRYQKKDFDKYLVKHRRKIALMHIWLKKYGALLIFINKHLYGIKFLVPAAIGVSKYDIKRFLSLNFLASLIWAGSLGGLAFYSSKAIVSLFDAYGQYSYVAVLAVFVLVALGLGWLNKIAKPKNIPES